MKNPKKVKAETAASIEDIEVLIRTIHDASIYKPLEYQSPIQKNGVKHLVLSENVVRKLEVAFMMDFTVSEACNYAGISRATYYQWRIDYPELACRFERAQDTLFQVAKIQVAARICAGDWALAMKFLEVRQGDKYANRKTEQEPAQLTEEENKRIDAAITKYLLPSPETNE